MDVILYESQISYKFIFLYYLNTFFLKKNKICLHATLTIYKKDQKLPDVLTVSMGCISHCYLIL